MLTWSWVSLLRRLNFRQKCRQKNVAKVPLSNELWSEKNCGVGSEDAAPDVGSSAVGRGESAFLTKGTAKRDKLLTNIRVRGPLPSLKFQECSSCFPSASSCVSSLGRCNGGQGLR